MVRERLHYRAYDRYAFVNKPSRRVSGMQACAFIRVRAPGHNKSTLTIATLLSSNAKVIVLAFVVCSRCAPCARGSGPWVGRARQCRNTSWDNARLDPPKERIPRAKGGDKRVAPGAKTEPEDQCNDERVQHERGSQVSSQRSVQKASRTERLFASVRPGAPARSFVWGNLVYCLFNGHQTCRVYARRALTFA